MQARGVGPVLRGTMCVAAAVLVHAALFLVPLGSVGRQEPPTVRGVRVRAFSAAPGRRPEQPVRPAESVRRATPTPQAEAPAGPSVGAPAGVGSGPGGGGGGPRAGGGTADGTGAGGNAGAANVGSDAYGQYLARLRSGEVQGWAAQASREARRGWRGSGGGAGGWGGGRDTGSGTGTGGGFGEGGGRDGYLDPRVKIVVTSYPPTSIERRHGPIPYPDFKFRKEQYASGWWNVYFQVWTDENGRIRKIVKLRPETDGPLEAAFVRQVRREIDRWTFDPVAAEIVVDVRFYVE